jgi:hypothetical protein
MAPMGYSGTWRKLIHEKSLKSKISCHTPFKFKSCSAAECETNTVRVFKYLYFL